jgi:hypothetical protein
VVATYLLELGYIILSIVAWCMLTSPDVNNECELEAPSLIELMVDMIILLYMRSLRLMSIIVFLCICGIPILYCYLKHKPKPTQNPTKLKANLNIVTLGSLYQLRNMNYRHKAVAAKNKLVKPDDLSQSLLDKTPIPSLS